MPWRGVPGGGFTEPSVRPWLPLGDVAACNVERQRSDPGSVLTLTRTVIAVRREEPDLRTGSYRSLAAPDGVWAWRRGDRHFVVLNMTDTRAVVPHLDGALRTNSDGLRIDEPVRGELVLAPWEGVIGATSPGVTTTC
jgi:alpha-glucosidase